MPLFSRLELFLFIRIPFNFCGQSILEFRCLSSFTSSQVQLSRGGLPLFHRAGVSQIPYLRDATILRLCCLLSRMLISTSTLLFRGDFSVGFFYPTTVPGTTETELTVASSICVFTTF